MSHGYVFHKYFSLCAWHVHFLPFIVLKAQYFTASTLSSFSSLLLHTSCGSLIIKHIFIMHLRILLRYWYITYINAKPTLWHVPLWIIALMNKSIVFSMHGIFLTLVKLSCTKTYPRDLFGLKVVVFCYCIQTFEFDF